jgi:AraC-like DNA-binding protein
MIHSTLLYSGRLVSITDVCCRSPACEGTEDEHASSDQAVFTRSGVFVKRMGRRSMLAEPAHVLFFRRNETYRVTHPIPGGDDCTVFHCSDALRRELTATFAVGVSPVPPPTLAAHHRLRFAIRAGRATPLQIEETSVGILASIVTVSAARRHPARESTAKARRRLVDETKLVLATRPSQSLSLSELARTVASSPFHLSRVFREEVGMPIHQYVLRLRLALALERLAQGEVELSSLALELGFSSHSHFATTFKRTFGAPPSSFRMS